MRPDQILPYTIRCENIATATAPAQVVAVTQQLDPNLDFSTFELCDFGFGGVTIPVPRGRTFFQTRVDARSTLRVFVDVRAELNMNTGLVTWTFTALDPETLDLPLDPFAGFLPPNANPPQGEGFVSYTVRAQPTAATGTRINARATIVFDDNPAIDTPQIVNTIDAGPPTSQVGPLPPVLMTPSFPVSWTGADDPGGCGVASYDVYVSVDGGPFSPLLLGTTETSLTFTGMFGHRYGFYSVATDNVGNRQATPAGAQVMTEVRIATTIQWVNAAGGDWNDPANWDLGRLPTATDDVVLNVPGITVTHASPVADAVLTLTTQAAINLAAGSLSIAVQATLHATFTISAGGTLLLREATLNGSGALVNQGTVVVQGNSIINLPFISTLRVLGGTASEAALTVPSGFTTQPSH